MTPRRACYRAAVAERSIDETFAWLAREVVDYERTLPDLRVSTKAAGPTLRAKIARAIDLTEPTPPLELLPFVRQLLRGFGVRGGHPRDFGYFSPAIRPAGVVGDALAALYNPQLSMWAQSPAAVELERHVLASLAPRLGFDRERHHACFTSGGSEANASGLCAALAHRYPQLPERGLRALDARPQIYRSAQAHGSVDKAAMVAGLGRAAVTSVPVDDAGAMRVDALRDALTRDRQAGLDPALVVATVGAPRGGAIDDVEAIAGLCDAHGAWLHVDAAWGGAFALCPRLVPLFEPLARADSLTVDAHKAIGAPMGAGMFFCRHTEAVARAFAVDASYATRPRGGFEDPYASTMQWSRRFIGLKVLLTLAEHGLDGWGARLTRLLDLADALRDLLRAAGFQVLNDTPLPLVCFGHEALAGDGERTRALAERVVRSGEAWLGATTLPTGQPALRACVTSQRTERADLVALVEAVRRALPPE